MESKVRHIRISDEVWSKIRLLASAWCMSYGEIIESSINETFLKYKTKLEEKIQIEVKQKTEEILPEPILELKIANYEKVKVNLTTRQHFETWINMFNEFRNKKLPQGQRTRLEQILNELIERYKNASQ